MCVCHCLGWGRRVPRQAGARRKECQVPTSGTTLPARTNKYSVLQLLPGSRWCALVRYTQHRYPLHQSIMGLGGLGQGGVFNFGRAIPGPLAMCTE